MAEEQKDKKRVDEEWKRQVREEKEHPPEKKDDERPPLPPANFALFLSGMGTQALIALGQIENPVTGKKEVSLDQAKYTIDMLHIIEEKTRGNLTKEEKQYLDQLLYNLRIAYVRTTSA